MTGNLRRMLRAARAVDIAGFLALSAKSISRTKLDQNDTKLG